MTTPKKFMLLTEENDAYRSLYTYFNTWKRIFVHYKIDNGLNELTDKQYFGCYDEESANTVTNRFPCNYTHMWDVEFLEKEDEIESASVNLGDVVYLTQKIKCSNKRPIIYT